MEDLAQRREEELNMARYTGPKDRLSRREGVDLFGKGAKLTRLNVPPGMHGPKGASRTQSSYNRQLREKQKAKRIYGILEKQFRNYMEDAMKVKGRNTADVLFEKLETRLDNVIYRLGFAPTRQMARQLVSHRHVFVNGKRVNIPSYSIRQGDTVTLSKKAAEIPSVALLLKKKDDTVPGWLQRKAIAGNVKRMPTRDDVTEPLAEQDIIEYYAR